MAKSKGGSLRSYFPVRLEVPTLAGGVGRQAPSKRLVTESENIDNMYVTIERSAEKRLGYELCDGVDLPGFLDIDSEGTDLWFYWFDVSATIRYLIIIDYLATGVNDQLMWAWQIREDGSYFEQSLGDIDTATREYITYNPSTEAAKDVLRAVTVGSSIVILNNKVKAGFTSDGSSQNLRGLDGSINTIETMYDYEGAAVDYQTSTTVDPEGEATVWTEFTKYIHGDKVWDAQDVHETDSTRYGIWQVKSDAPATVGPDGSSSPGRPKDTAAHWERVTDEAGANRYTEYISVNDYFYPDITQKWLGQAVAMLSSLKFPPTASALTARNNAEDTIKTLYPHSGDVDGKGKIYYLSQAYLTLSEGYFRVINRTDQPYLEKIRTPENMSVIDKRRMPHQIVLDDSSGWLIRSINWDHRKSGDKTSNPGPSIFHDGEGNGVQNEITSLAYYRDRLFFGANDTLFCSRLGDFDNLWLDDSSNITVADPIDLKVSSNSYSPITYLKPFRDFLFLATDGSTQFELLGSENTISPLTAEIAPTSFYNMTPDIEPITMNNSLYFFGKRRMYIYFGEQSESQVSAMETSINCPDYLPTYYDDITVSSQYSTIFVTDKEHKNTIYCYTNRINGDQIIQNSFYRWIIGGDVSILSHFALDDFLYMVVENEGSISLGRVPLKNNELTKPRMDSLQLVSSSECSINYDESLDETNIVYEGFSLNVNKIMIWAADQRGLTADVSDAANGPSEGTVSIRIPGDYSTIGDFYVGHTFDTVIDLSTQYLRDQQGMAKNGSLNLRYGLFRIFNSGTFDVTVERKGRAAKLNRFYIDAVSERDSTLDYIPYEEEAIFRVPLMGRSSDLKIKVTTDSPYPLTVSNIEFAGKFKFKTHALGD